MIHIGPPADLAVGQDYAYILSKMYINAATVVGGIEGTLVVTSRDIRAVERYPSFLMHVFERILSDSDRLASKETGLGMPC